MKADPRERWCKEIAAAQAPQDRPRQTRNNTGCEERRETRIFAGRSALDHFMEMAELQSSARHMGVHLSDIERQHCGRRAAVIPSAQASGANRQ